MPFRLFSEDVFPVVDLHCYQDRKEILVISLLQWNTVFEIIKKKKVSQTIWKTIHKWILSPLILKYFSLKMTEEFSDFIFHSYTLPLCYHLAL